MPRCAASYPKSGWVRLPLNPELTRVYSSGERRKARFMLRPPRA